jgi:hypothetical protein
MDNSVKKDLMHNIIITNVFMVIINVFSVSLFLLLIA